MRRFLFLAIVIVLIGCASRNPQTIMETGVKKEFIISSHRDKIIDCISTNMDAYQIHAFGGNENAVTIRRYEDRTELFLFPSLVILRDNGRGANVEIIVKQPYWKTEDMLEKFESFIKGCEKINTTKQN